MTAITYLAALFRLGRPLFLTGGFLLYALGVLIALVGGAPINPRALLWGQVAVTAVQLMTHYGNEYYDLPADRRNPSPTRWSGGSRVLVRGQVAPAVALSVTLFFGVVGLAAGVGLVTWFGAGTPALVLIALAAVLALGYSAPPLRLHSRGLGELTVALIVTLLTPVLGFYLQAGRLALSPFLAVAPLFPLQFAMMLVLELPDATGDALVGKHTLVVHLGLDGAVRAHNAALAVSYGSLPFLVWAGLPPLAAGAVLLGAPVAAWQAVRLARGSWTDPSTWDSASFWAIGLLVGPALAELAAFLWLYQSR